MFAGQAQRDVSPEREPPLVREPPDQEVVEAVEVLRRLAHRLRPAARSGVMTGIAVV
ncbi:hypothetical protein CITRIK5_10281 [Citricoccus sp. K5]|nr:hypothetical protein CITRIK5_10281 [Citricoccus sp. K5]